MSAEAVRHSLATLTFALLTLIAALGIATPAVEAQFFDDLGRRAYAKGKFEQALEAFALVQEIAPSPRALYNMAVCADLAGKSEAAFAHYREYLAGADEDATRRKDAAERASRLEARLALVEITSEPMGAAIYLERKELGQHGTTPRTIVAMPGEQKLMLELEGYEPTSVTVVAQTGSVRSAPVRLTALVGRLTVDVQPASAKVEFVKSGQPLSARLVDGQYELPTGQVAVVASAPGYASSRSLAVVRQGTTSQVTLGLALLPQPTGRLLVSSGAPGADVLVDGKHVAVTPATLPELSVGKHELEVRHKGQSVHRSVTISEGRATYVEVDLAVPK